MGPRLFQGNRSVGEILYLIWPAFEMVCFKQHLSDMFLLNTFHRPDKGDVYFSRALDEACQTPVNLVKLDVSKNRDPPKWMVKIMENPIKMDDLGGVPIFLG